MVDILCFAKYSCDVFRLGTRCVAADRPIASMLAVKQRYITISGVEWWLLSVDIAAPVRNSQQLDLNLQMTVLVSDSNSTERSGALA